MNERSVPLDVLFPRPVLVTLAGIPYRAGPLTLGDLADLQSWLRQAAGHPLAGLPPGHMDPDPSTRRARLVSAWHESKRWPPEVGSGDEPPYLESPEGRAVFLVLCLKRYDDSFTADEAAMLAEEMTAGDWANLRRIAWGIPPWRELAGELDPVWLEHQIKSAADGPGWSEAIVKVMQEGKYGYAEIEKWTPAMLAAYCSEGKAGEYRAVMAPDESREEFVARMLATFSADEQSGQSNGD